jgi:hypothetical protein
VYWARRARQRSARDDGRAAQPENTASEGPAAVSSAAGKPGGLFDGFGSYRTPTDADYRDVLTTGLVVPDTNVFLNLYRYNEQTRNDLFSVLRSLGDRLWVPRQVVAEFWRNREIVLQDPRDTDKTIRELNEQHDKAVGTFRAWANRVGLSQEHKAELTEVLSHAFWHRSRQGRKTSR